MNTERQSVHVDQIDAVALYDDRTVQNVHRKIERSLESRPLRHLMLDFANVSSIGTAGLSMLVRVKRQCDERGCQLGLYGLTPIVREVLGITKLDQLIDICEGPEP